MLYGIIIGIIAGYIASRLQKGASSGLLANLVLGLLGGFVGGYLFSLFGLESHSWLGEIVTSVVGAVIVLWVFSKMK